MNRRVRLIKRVLALVIVLAFSIESFAAVVGDNDGAAFITKAEFDSLKSTFQSQIDRYNASIDNKIDGAISSYLSGIQVAGSGTSATISNGIYWSIGPFDRPRYKQAIPIYDLLASRAHYSKDRDDYASTYYMICTWGDNFYKKVQPTVADYFYTDLIVSDVKSNNGATFNGIYKKSSHWLQAWSAYMWDREWGDQMPAFFGESTILAGAQAGNGNRGGNSHRIDFAWRTSKLGNEQNNYVAPSVLPGDLATGLGKIANYTLKKGDEILWNENIISFGPIPYHCFNEEINSYDYGALNYNDDIRDEILYVDVDLTKANKGAHNVTTSEKNLWHRNVYDASDKTNNPWNQSSLTNADSYFLNGWKSGSTNVSYKYTLYLPVGYWNNDLQKTGANFKWVYNYGFKPDVRFADISDWSQLGSSMTNVVQKYINDKCDPSISTVYNSLNKQLLSLASGIPIALVESGKRATITGEFRKDCSYSYINGSNVLNEGTIDNTDTYVVYAKLSPFDMSKLPEEEYDDLLDISSDPKNAANFDKLDKCLIVTDGKMKLTFDNMITDKVLFLKWEKLSNWNSTGGVYTRKTGQGTNTDVKVRLSNTQTISPPTWEYFGGGYLKIDPEYTWVDIK